MGNISVAKSSPQVIEMTDCDLDTSVPDWIIEHPATTAVFRELGIDDSCGGKSLAYACRQRGLDPQTVLARLLGRLEVKRQDSATNGQE